MGWVEERLSVIGYINDVMSLEVLAQKSQIQSDRFHQTFYEAGMLKALRKTTLRYQISSSARRKSFKVNFIHREDCKLLLFHVLNNKLLESNEVLIYLFVAVSLRINTIQTQ